MGNKQEVPSFYNTDFVNKESQNKKGADREINCDPSPKTYSLPNYIKNDNYKYLKLVTWNLNMEAHSSYATDEWIKNNNKWDLIYQQCEKQDADIISFQEVPKPYYGMNNNNDNDKKQEKIHELIQKYIDSNNWYITFSPSSHCGYTLILVNKRLEKSFNIFYDDDIDPTQKFPAIILREKVENEEKQNKENKEHNKLILFGCHLHPFSGDINASKRRKEFDRLYNIANEKGMSEYFVIFGDMNMRYNEEIDIVKTYNNKLLCCWDIIPNDFKNNCMFTWYRNYFEVGADGTSRYDKVFYAQKIKCIQCSIFDQNVSNDKYHFLSDHRALSVVLEIQ